MIGALVFFDLETGGIADECPDIQIAAVAVDSEWKERGVFEARIEFDETKAVPEALTLNHYDPDVWARTAEPERRVVARFASWLDPFRSVKMVSRRTGRPYSVARLAGYNAATFDGPRLTRMFARHETFLPAHPQVFCVLQRAHWWFLEKAGGVAPENMKLGTMCGVMGIPFATAHEALADVRATVEVARILCGQKAA
jgi:exonuclease I